MRALLSRAGDVVGVRHVRLPSGGRVAIRTLRVRLGRATPGHLRPGTLAATYTDKPLVSVRGDAMFGELAIVRLLAEDGWDAVWVDTFHQRLWRAMPHRSAPVALPAPARATYDAIVAANGGRTAGFFDVMAWRDDRVAFLEYRGPDDRPNRNEARWIEAALDAGISAGDLWSVRCGDPDEIADGHADDQSGADATVE